MKTGPISLIIALVLSYSVSTAQTTPCKLVIGNKTIAFNGQALIGDTSIQFKTPYLIGDTAYATNVETLEEELVVSYRNEISLSYDLGTISKADINAAIDNQFGLKACNAPLARAFFTPIDSPTIEIEVNYENPASIAAAKQAVLRLKSAYLVFSRVIFLTEPRKDYEAFWFAALMKVKE
jgi:hypothetical protein